MGEKGYFCTHSAFWPKHINLSVNISLQLQRGRPREQDEESWKIQSFSNPHMRLRASHALLSGNASHLGADSVLPKIGVLPLEFLPNPNPIKAPLPVLIHWHPQNGLFFKGQKEYLQKFIMKSLV